MITVSNILGTLYAVDGKIGLCFVQIVIYEWLAIVKMKVKNLNGKQISDTEDLFVNLWIIRR